LNSRAPTALQRKLIQTALLSLVVGLVCFVLLLYTPWQWPRYLAMVVIPIGALSVFIGVGTTWFGDKNGA
jgi:MFS superfamily sulfate permease-like transporter